MKKENWGEKIWEEKAKAQGGVGVAKGSTSSIKDVHKKVNFFFNNFDKFFKKKIKKGSVLDCGVGPLASFSIEFTKRGYKVTAVDISKTSLLLAQKNAGKDSKKIKFIKDNLVTLKKINQKFDLVFCVGTFGHIPKYLALETLQTFYKKTKKGGTCLVDFWLEEKKTFKSVLYNFLYWTGHTIKRSFSKTFHVNVSRYNEEEIKDMASRIGFKIIGKFSSYYLLKK